MSNRSLTNRSRGTRTSPPATGVDAQKRPAAVIEETDADEDRGGGGTIGANANLTSPIKRGRADPSSRTTPTRSRGGRSGSGSGTPQLVTPSGGATSPTIRAVSAPTSSDEESTDNKPSHARRLPFGRSSSDVSITTVTPAIRRVYSLVNRVTGSIGGNGSGGAIYGELTSGSMQKMVDLMKIHTNLGPASRFIDVGCGLGKPNLHVATDPGVEFSYGIEMEEVRWLLGLTNLDAVLRAAEGQRKRKVPVEEGGRIGSRCTFAFGDVTEARFFDPFTHVYMFDIGFPPALFYKLADMYNRSRSPYLICFHGPRLIVDEYGFDVELIVQTPTSMHGSSEGHMGYVYRRSSSSSRGATDEEEGEERAEPMPGLPEGVPCDPLFAGPWRTVRNGFEELRAEVRRLVEENHRSGRPKRARGPPKQK